VAETEIIIGDLYIPSQGILKLSKSEIILLLIPIRGNIKFHNYGKIMYFEDLFYVKKLFSGPLCKLTKMWLKSSRDCIRVPYFLSCPASTSYSTYCPDVIAGL
jgi:hypothetical protein